MFLLVCFIQKQVRLELGEVRSFISAYPGQPSGGREEKM